MNFQELAKPFDKNQVKSLTNRYKDKKTGEQKQYTIHFITARTVMNRLDTVCGPQNWRTEFVPQGKNVQCTLYLRIGEEWVGKSDLGTPSDIEPEKGAVSDALKRAAVHWGIGRELYREGVADLSGLDVDDTHKPDARQSAQNSAQTGGNGKRHTDASIVHDMADDGELRKAGEWTRADDHKDRLTKLRNNAAMLWKDEDGESMNYAHVYNRILIIAGAPEDARKGNKSFPKFVDLMQEHCTLTADVLWLRIQAYDHVPQPKRKPAAAAAGAGR